MRLGSLARKILTVVTYCPRYDPEGGVTLSPPPAPVYPTVVTSQTVRPAEPISHPIRARLSHPLERHFRI